MDGGHLLDESIENGDVSYPFFLYLEISAWLSPIYPCGCTHVCVHMYDVCRKPSPPLSAGSPLAGPLGAANPTGSTRAWS